jgi:hypothetical protein
MTPSLEDVLNEFAAELDEAGASYPLLKSWIARYPAYARELADLAAGEALLRHSPPASEQIDDQPLMQAGLDAALGVLERARRERPVAAPASSVVQSLMARARELGLNISQVADRTQLSVTLVGVLDRRLVRFASIPREVVDSLAAVLQTQVESISGYLEQSPAFAPSASFRADEAPTLPPVQEFADAVRQDPMLDANRKAALLRMTPPASG